MKKISVIIPVFNVEKYIEQCLKSVVAQTYSNLEIILIDDLGFDKSIKIAKEYALKDERIKIIHHKKNLGLGESRNTGIKNASGEFIFFLDSDDYLDSRAIESAYLEIKKTNSDIVVLNTVPFCEEKNDPFLSIRLKDMQNWFDFKIKGEIKIEQENFNNALKLIPTVSWGKLFRTSFLKENKIFFANKNIIHEDEGFFIKFMSNFPKISLIENVGVYYRLRKNSLSFEVLNKKKNERKANLKISVKDSIDYIKKNFSAQKSKLLLNSIWEVYDSFDLFSSCFGIFYKKIWTNETKKIRFLGLTIFTQKTKEDIVETKILGICVEKWRKNEKNIACTR